MDLQDIQSETAVPERPATLDQAPPDPATQDLERASDPALTEDLALALLERRDLPTLAVEHLTINPSVMKSRRVRFVVAAHPHAPRHISLRLIREFYTFDLMRFALVPAVSGDLKRAADELLVTRIKSITLGERISLARRGSGTIAAALLLDKEQPVWQVALENARLTEAAIIKGLLRPNTSPAVVEAICHHAKWYLRHEIRITLLRNPHTPLARALEFARTLLPAQLRDILHSSRLPARVKTYLRKNLNERTSAR